MSSRTRAPSTWWLTRFVILRRLGFVYCFAFLSLANQVLPLIGDEGLLPADRFLGRLAALYGSRWQGFLEVPSIFWTLTRSSPGRIERAPASDSFRKD